MSAARWRIRLSEAAEQDFLAIVRWTAQSFGPRQAATYRATLVAALTVLERGPDVPGAMARDEIQAGLRSLHVARQGRRGRHFVLYRTAEPGTVEIVRILHDAMDLPGHVTD